MTSDDFVNINVRLKPPPKRKSFQHSLKVISTHPAVLLSLDKQQTFNFDNIFSEESSQDDVYQKSVKPLVQKVKEGFNCTIFAYGQTGTGKTYTMGTNPEEKSAGIISRALEDFFLFENDQQEFDVQISFMEIYNEKVFDLLQNDNRDSISVKGLRIDGLSINRVFNVYDAKHFLEMGGRNRHTGETKQNMFSSRSHAIFTIHFTVNYKDITTTAKLNLVDLAGSESVKKAGTHGNSFQEGININKGLLCIGQVMTALSSNASYIPYRQSVITSILQDSLNKNNYISLIACVKCGIEDSNESIQTLEFAQRVKRMKNKPEINEILTKYKTENPVIFGKSKSATPLKRPAGTPFKINPFKKPRGPSVQSNLSVPSSTIFENSKSVSSNFDGSNFSPVIRKYMSELENTIIDKLQTVIQNTLTRPTRRSTRLSLAGNKDNTPKYSWNQIQHKVSKLVQEEVLQLTTKTSRATSSPLDHDELKHAKRILKYNSPVYNDVSKSDVNTRTSLASHKLNETKKSTPAVSPIVLTPLNNGSVHSDMDFMFKKPMTPEKLDTEKSIRDRNDTVAPRRSTRIFQRRNSVLENTQLDTSNMNSIPEDKNHQSMNNSDRIVRRSRRLTAFKMPKACECKSIPLNKPKKPNSKMNKKDCPSKNRTKEVLHILNLGDKKELQKLPTIGPKTADRILLFRHLKGNFKTIKELADMPGWSTTYFQNFVDQNFLKF